MIKVCTSVKTAAYIRDIAFLNRRDQALVQLIFCKSFYDIE